MVSGEVGCDAAPSARFISNAQRSTSETNCSGERRSAGAGGEARGAAVMAKPWNRYLLHCSITALETLSQCRMAISDMRLLNIGRCSVTDTAVAAGRHACS